jgi:cbb3-type cytochrome oxidase maturation protein
MTILAFLIPITLGMGAVGLSVFFWSVRSNQYDDLSGDAERILFDDDHPLPAASARLSNTTKETAP